LKAIRDEEFALAAVTTDTGKRGKVANAGAASNGNKKKKTKASQGVEKLKKANVVGMSKLSTFFTQKSA
jgi:ribonuclease H2 subunit B